MGDGAIMISKYFGVAIVSLALLGSGAAASAALSGEYRQALNDLRQLPAVIEEISPPEIADPQWVIDARKARELQANRQFSAGGSRTFTYRIEVWGSTSASLAEFRLQAAETFADSRGWSRTGAVFQEVATGGEFVLVLSEAQEIERRYAPGCSAEYSCRVGQYVIINQDRWTGATSSWNAAGGSLRDYRHMVINHEVGHWLGHGHSHCSAPDQPAPVMQQQSINLEGCRFNPWPLSSELWLGR